MLLLDEDKEEDAAERLVDARGLAMIGLGTVGFPQPGHPFWTSQTLAGMAQRYPGLDLTPWRPDAG